MVVIVFLHRWNVLRSVRRSFIAERYVPLVTALYDGAKEAHISLEVTFEDGRKGKIEGTMQVVEMPVYPPAALKEAAE